MAYIAGWKDILRPIRDGYRHLFPSPDTGPTPEERGKQRKADAIKGFAYFDTFDQLENWTENQSDPIARSNTPLLRRTQPPEESSGKAKVLLCHDYCGNYHAYESGSSVGVDEERYACENLQFVDTFIYFSHKLVCVPPPTGTNLLHRNGVKSIGTFLVEPQTKDADRLLMRALGRKGGEDNSSVLLAHKLANIAKHYGFDGWLINIEKPFSKDVWDPKVLQAFLEQLRDELGPARSLIWYDALTIDNKVAYQNGLTTRNISFAKSCTQVLTNYCWEVPYIQTTIELAQEHGIRLDDIFFGVDVWAQNTTKLTQPRTTYGGGGTNTGIAVAELSAWGLSAGIFAPAWPFEHFPNSHHRRDVDRNMWYGKPHRLPKDLTCSCSSSIAGCRKQHRPALESHITASATRFTVGSSSFFWTDFKRGFGRHREREAAEIYGGKQLHAQLSAQSLLPNIPCAVMPSSHSTASEIDARGVYRDNAMNVPSWHLEDRAGFSQCAIEIKSSMGKGEEKAKMYDSWLSLFSLDMPADGSLSLRMRAQKLLIGSDARVSAYLKFNDGSVTKTNLPELEDATISVGSIAPPNEDTAESGRLQELGIHMRAPYLGDAMRVAVIQEICITPKSRHDYTGKWSIDDIRIEQRGEEDSNHRRLCWTFRGPEDPRLEEGLPYSELTGPISYFSLRVDGMGMGRAYATEYVLQDTVVDLLRGEAKEIEVVGVGFDGSRIAEAKVELHV